MGATEISSKRSWPTSAITIRPEGWSIVKRQGLRRPMAHTSGAGKGFPGADDRMPGTETSKRSRAASGVRSFWPCPKRSFAAPPSPRPM